MEIDELQRLFGEKDEQERSPMDVACYLGYKNMVVYLMLNMGKAADIVS